MKIKNLALFRRRANAHAKAGHVLQGTYGDAKLNGKADYQGCFVACLATPHTQKGLRKLLAPLVKKAKEDIWNDAGKGLWALNIGGEEHKKWIKKEFGLNTTLLTVIEGFFEAQRTHGAAIEFVPAVARALNEGADITPRDVRRFVEEELELTQKRMITPPRWAGTGGYEPAVYRDVPVEIEDHEYYAVQLALRKGNVPKQTKQFLAWLEAQKPVTS